MCNNNNSSNNNNRNNCITEILQVILVLQQSACGPDSCLDSCDRPMLGCGTPINCNTRPVTLYTCCGNGTPWSMPTTREADCTNTGDTSCVFRIEKLDGNCATFRVLVPNTDTTSLCAYEATDSFFTINTDCVCAIKCLNDTCVDCL